MNARASVAPAPVSGAWSDRRVASLLAALALALRLLMVIGVPTLFTADSPSYLRIAADLAERGEFHDPRLGMLRLPAYPVFLAGLLLLPLDGDAGVALGQALLGALAAGAAYCVGRGLGASRRASTGLALFVAFAPPYLLFDRAVMAESLAVAAGLAFAAAALDLARHPLSRARAAATGLLSAIFVLTRLNGLPLVVLLPIPFAMAWWRAARDRRQVRRAAACALILVIAFLAPMAPWLAWNRARFGAWSPFASPAKVRLVYAAQLGLVDVDGALRSFAGRIDVRDRPDPTMQLFWSLAALESSGEPEARALLKAARVERPAEFRAAGLRTIAHFLGWTGSGSELSSWLEPGAQQRWRAEARSRRYLPGAGMQSGSVLVGPLAGGCSAYQVLRPLLALCMALVLLRQLRRAPGSSRRLDLAGAALLFAYLATALLHGWTLADYTRFFVPFDWVPVALLAAAMTRAPELEPLATRDPVH